jgi:hypothetical protein
VLQELEEEARDSWEERAAYYASRVTNLAGEASEALDETRWSRRDCAEYQDELDWEMRAFCTICGELKPSEMPSKMRRAAWLRKERVNQEFHRATRIVDRILRAHNCRPGEASRTRVSRNQYNDAGCRDEFMGDRELTAEVACEECSIPMDRRPTLRVSEILGMGKPEQSWDEVQESGEACPAQSERS